MRSSKLASPTEWRYIPNLQVGVDPISWDAHGSIPGAVSGTSLIAQANVGDDSMGTKSVALGQYDPAQPVPAARDASDDVSRATPVKHDFQYLIYYVWSELPPAEKPAEIVLRSLKDIPIGTPVEEIKRASDAFGLDFNFMANATAAAGQANP